MVAVQSALLKHPRPYRNFAVMFLEFVTQNWYLFVMLLAILLLLAL